MFDHFFKWWVSYDKQELLILWEYLDSSRDCFRVNRVAQFSVSCIFHHVSGVASIDGFSGLSILDNPFGFL
jgi:hypothetical protein